MSLQRLTPSISSFLRQLCDRFESNDAIVLEQQSRTYGAIEKASAALARCLLAAGVGVGVGTRVGVLFPNGIDWVVAFFATTRIGAVAVPIIAPWKMQ